MPAHEKSGAEPASLQSAVAELARELRQAGLASPEQDARRLVAAAAGRGREALLLTPDARLDLAAAQRLESYRQRRLRHEPVSRILGARAFYGREFAVTPATLDPRPETETVIEAVLELVDREGWRYRPLRILDVGTGSGCILATLLAELPLASGVGTDISRAALDVAAKNAASVGVADRAGFTLRRSLDGLDASFDILVSNPPYIRSDDIAHLDRDVRDFDPLAALDGGADGLGVYREIVAGARRVVPSGWLVFEVGAEQADDVAGLMAEAPGPSPPADTRRWTDLGGHVRCVAARTQL